MNEALKIRFYPNKEQKILIHKTFGSCRMVYNRFLNKKMEAYNKDKTDISVY